MRLAIILAEIGRPAPDLSNLKKYFPEADFQVFNEHSLENIFPDHWRWGWRMNDYWKVKKCLEADADIAIAFDADMRIVSRDAAVLPLLAERFGICLPANPRHLVRADTEIGADSDGLLDETNGAGYAYNCSPIAINLNDPVALHLAKIYCRIMRERPVRGPLAWWRAVWQEGTAPYLLPPQWCVCEHDIGIGREIILHEGHEKVKAYYRGRL